MADFKIVMDAGKADTTLAFSAETAPTNSIQIQVDESDFAYKGDLVIALRQMVDKLESTDTNFPWSA